AVSVDSDPSQPHPSIHVPVPTLPMVLRSKSSGAVMHSKEDTSEYVKTKFKPEDRRAMSPRRSGENIEALIRELRADLSRHAKLLRESLDLTLTRIETVKSLHDKLDKGNKLMKTYIEDLVRATKPMASGGHEI
ncbi:hypothetical protein BGZ61DRAFT_372632, partial [Ilyonectria robusta]|uniref:uncharacterized protein n=1 Tax=Ilyonectria robusta TaxID=1079257 RepID=UPI001E8E0764